MSLTVDKTAAGMNHGQVDELLMELNHKTARSSCLDWCPTISGDVLTRLVCNPNPSDCGSSRYLFNVTAALSPGKGGVISIPVGIRHTLGQRPLREPTNSITPTSFVPVQLRDTDFLNKPACALHMIE